MGKTWTPEPWAIPTSNVFAIGASSTLRDESGCIVQYKWRRTIVNDALDGGSAGMPKWPDTDDAAAEASANMRRIVACVNACRSMPDPDAEIARLKRIEEAAREIGGPDGDGPYRMVRNDELAALQAALNGDGTNEQ